MSLRWLAILLAMCGPACHTADRPAASASQPMNMLHIALHEGFTDHTVNIRVNGREVYRKSGVKTDLAISRADAVDVDAGSAKAMVEVTVEPGGSHKSVEVDVSATPNLGVSREKDGQLTFVVQRDIFRYM